MLPTLVATKTTTTLATKPIADGRRRRRQRCVVVVVVVILVLVSISRRLALRTLRRARCWVRAFKTQPTTLVVVTLCDDDTVRRCGRRARYGVKSPFVVAAMDIATVTMG
jgi:hypothetical protein